MEGDWNNSVDPGKLHAVHLSSLAVDPKHLDIQYHTVFLTVTGGQLVQPKAFQLKGSMEGRGPPHRARWRKR